MIPFDFISCDENYSIIPIHCGCDSYYTISFEGWPGFSLDVNDETFIQICKISSLTFTSFVREYSEKFAFTKPILSFGAQDNKVKIKFGMMCIERYHEMIEKFP